MIGQRDDPFVATCSAMHREAWHGVELADHDCWYCPLCQAYRHVPPSRD